MGVGPRESAKAATQTEHQERSGLRSPSANKTNALLEVKPTLWGELRRTTPINLDLSTTA